MTDKYWVERHRQERERQRLHEEEMADYKSVPVSDEEQKKRNQILRRKSAHEKWLERKHYQRFGDIEVNSKHIA